MAKTVATDIEFIVATEWQSDFEQYLVNDYRKVTASHHQPRENTIKTACQHVRVFSMWWEATFEDRFEPVKITNFALRRWQRHSLDEAQVAPATWNGRLWALGIFCAWIERVYGAQYAGLMDGLELKEEGCRAPKHRSLTELEILHLMQDMEVKVRGVALAFQYVTNLRNQTIITIMLNTGLRVSEAVDLRWADIQIHDRSGSVRVRNGKGGKERKVPLNPDVRLALSTWMKVSELDGNPATTDLLWAGKGTANVSTRQIERIVTDVCAGAGIPGVTPHWLRYSFAKRLEQAGVPLATISKLLGHDSIQSTMTYLQSSAEELQSAVDRLN